MKSNDITRLVLDEFHELFLNDDFRPEFKRLWEMAFTSCQRIQLSATCPPHLEKTVMERTLLDPALTRWIRGETNRPEIRYHVMPIDTKKHDIVPALANVAKVLEQKHFDKMSRGVIFASSIDMVKDLAKEMNCFTHHSGQKLENDINMARWKDGGHTGDNQRFISQQWMAATPGLINGIDLDRIDAVIFGEEGMGGLFGGVQGAGRGGRTGHPCMCVFVTSGTFNPPQTGEDLSCVDHMKKWTKGNICLRLVPSGVMDGKPETCQSLKERYSNTEFCDKCQPGTVIARLILQAIENTPEPRHITCLDGIDDNDNSSLGPMISVVDCAVPSAPASVLSTVSKNRSYEDRRKALTSSKVSKKSQQSSNRSTTSSTNSRTTSTPSESSRPWESARPG